MNITGLGTFFDAPVNPSEVLVRRLEKKLNGSKEVFLGDGVRMESVNVIEAAAEAIDVFLEMFYDSLDENNHETRKLCVHLGVDMGADSFLLEFQGRNEATFSRPDERGFQPYREQVTTDRDLSHSLMTGIPIHNIKRKLQKRGESVGVSIDAGRFVCNWMYYRSLQHSLRLDNVGVLFVHIPSFDVISEEDQITFLCELIQCVATIRWD